jgi:hypothetical protein
MPRFIFSFRSAKDFDPAADPSALPAWARYLNQVIEPNVIDPGWPVFEPSTLIGETGTSTRLGGFVIVAADDLETAVKLASECPTIERGGGVEVGLLAELPREHPAEMIRSRLADGQIARR